MTHSNSLFDPTGVLSAKVDSSLGGPSPQRNLAKKAKVSWRLERVEVQLAGRVQGEKQRHYDGLKVKSCFVACDTGKTGVGFGLDPRLDPGR